MFSGLCGRSCITHELMGNYLSFFVVDSAHESRRG